MTKISLAPPPLRPMRWSRNPGVQSPVMPEAVIIPPKTSMVSAAQSILSALRNICSDVFHEVTVCRLHAGAGNNVLAAHQLSEALDVVFDPRSFPPTAAILIVMDGDTVAGQDAAPVGLRKEIEVPGAAGLHAIHWQWIASLVQNQRNVPGKDMVDAL